MGEALKIAEPEGFIRLFLDEGPAMAQLLSEAASQGVMQDYIGKLLAEFEAQKGKSIKIITRPLHQHLVEPLSQRELEILHLLAKGLSNRVIAERLFLAVDTIKGHNRNIFNKLAGSKSHRSCHSRPRARLIVSYYFPQHFPAITNINTHNQH